MNKKVSSHLLCICSKEGCTNTCILQTRGGKDIQAEYPSGPAVMMHRPTGFILDNKRWAVHRDPETGYYSFVCETCAKPKPKQKGPPLATGRYETREALEEAVSIFTEERKWNPTEIGRAVGVSSTTVVAIQRKQQKTK